MSNLNPDCLVRTFKHDYSTNDTTVAIDNSDQFNWWHYQHCQNGDTLDPLLSDYVKDYWSELNQDDLSTITRLNQDEKFTRLVGHINARGYSDGYEADQPDQPTVNIPLCPIPKQWVTGIARSILDWSYNDGYSNGMNDW